VQILVVIDDDDRVREAVGCLIKSLGHAVETFESADEYLRSGRVAAKGGRPHVAMKRLLAPVMNANELRNIPQPAIGRSLATALPNPLLLGHRAIRDDIAWGVLTGRIGLRHLFTPQTG
jgi:hypothetical protein